jgi:excisionase family DNA binding protein
LKGSGTISQEIRHEMSFVLSDGQIDTIRNKVFEIIREEVNSVRHETLLNVRYFKKGEACKYLNVSYNTLDVWIMLGLPKITIGNSVRFDRIELDKWMQGMSVGC